MDIPRNKELTTLQADPLLSIALQVLLPKRAPANPGARAKVVSIQTLSLTTGAERHPGADPGRRSFCRTRLRKWAIGNALARASEPQSPFLFILLPLTHWLVLFKPPSFYGELVQGQAWQEALV